MLLSITDLSFLLYYSAICGIIWLDDSKKGGVGFVFAA